MTEATPNQTLPKPALRVPPSTAGATASIVIGALMFVGGWVLVGLPAESSYGSLGDIVNIPSLVQKNSGGILVATSGMVLFVGGLLGHKVAAWALWVHRSRNQ